MLQLILTIIINNIVDGSCYKCLNLFLVKNYVGEETILDM